ncbi:TraE/TraK family type IV conjugative transfer system protein [Burkholderia anthina]|uniref:TraE/TraK family type IV conjugative transfer system protein n=1 Tax=Burkholderia anthina TaxID=179879 RepID=UPI001588B25C|nr:TraE/TraK family type IV conjugative transfer system protein [Burkholderia anthina]
MKLGKFRLNWDDTTAVAKQLALAVVLLTLANIALVIKICTDHERLVLTPPHLNGKAEVGWNSANSEYYKGWGLYIAATLGSVTPRNAVFIAQQLEPFFDAALWPKIAVQIMSIPEDPNYARNGTLNVFTPRDVMWEPSTSKVYVSGMLSTTAYRNSSLPVAEIIVTYEMSFHMVNGLPKVSYFNSYTGAPRTLKWLSNHQGDPSLAKKPGQSAPTSIIPQESELRAQMDKAREDALAAEAASAPAASGAAVANGASGASASSATSPPLNAASPANSASNPGGQL